jgi:hypothetical protein
VSRCDPVPSGETPASFATLIAHLATAQH